MGLMDQLKKATGVGLNAAEHYDRAYEKGVLLGPAKFAEAASMFDAAAKKAAESGHVEIHVRATANARLYGFITSGNVQHLPDLATALHQLGEIEIIGSRTESMPAAALLAEVNARLVESRLSGLNPRDEQGLASAHAEAASAFRQFFSSPLVTYRYQHADRHVETAQSRFFFHQGLSSWYQAISAVPASPEGAAEQMGKSLNAFRQCGDERWSSEAQGWLADCRLKRTCWMCHREFQGAGIHFKRYPAVTTPYAASVVAGLGQDASAIDVASGVIILCGPCGSALERQADHYASMRAAEARAALEGQIGELADVVRSMTSRIRDLESAAHRHL
jgi:hypothetical protein